MSRNALILLILIIPVSIWLNLYAYYKYGRFLIKRRGNPSKKGRIGGGGAK